MKASSIALLAPLHRGLFLSLFDSENLGSQVHHYFARMLLALFFSSSCSSRVAGCSLDEQNRGKGAANFAEKPDLPSLIKVDGIDRAIPTTEETFLKSR
jgi:hypothetical protein